ncbi:MAG: hypothetical protein P8P74_12815 [Crocinitomicaceae bacterium]|nr:hypothetical protein [Crocinitomicaceae bacterium]
MSAAPNNIWSSIKRLLVVVDFKEIDNMNQWRESIKFSGLNIHDSKIMGIVESKKERLILGEMSSVVFISEKDYGFIGRLKNEDAQQTFNDRYDALIIVGEIPKKIEKSISKMAFKIDISLNSENSAQTINLQTEETAPKYMLKFVKQTLERIS